MDTDPPDEDFEDSIDIFDLEDDLDDSPIETAAEVSCPYCGASVLLIIDPAGGSRQQYVEDCEVCCQPWSVLVQFDGWGAAEVVIEQIY